MQFLSGSANPGDNVTNEAPLVAKTDKMNGVQIVKNGSKANKHSNNNLDKKQSSLTNYENSENNLGKKYVPLKDRTCSCW